MEFRQLQSFSAVVESGSFTKAAEELDISQPTISTHIQQLEEELSARLVIRTTRALMITPRGKELYEFASRILSMRSELMDRWEDEQQKKLMVGASTIPASYILPDLLSGFRRKDPEMFITVTQGDSSEVLTEVTRGTYDIGFIGKKTDDPQLECMPICEDHLVLITPVQEPFLTWKKSGTVETGHLRKTPFILREKGSASQETANVFLNKLGIDEKDLPVAGYVSEHESLKNLVASGLGVAMISYRAAADGVASGRLLSFEIADAAVRRSLYCIYRKESIWKPGLLSFLEYLKQENGQKK